jgi:Flp pilus assembly protein TadG
MRVPAMLRDCSGGTAIIMALSMSALVGLAALGTEVADWYVTKRTMQTAADAAAASAAAALIQGASPDQLQNEAQSVAAQNGFANGITNTLVTVKNPPESGPNSSDTSAVEVIISQPQQALLSTLFLGSNPTIGARAVGVGKLGACAVALGNSDPAVWTGGSASINLNNCDLDANAGVSTGGSGSISATNVNASGNCSGNVSATKNLNCDTDAPTQVSDPYASYTVPTFGACGSPSGSASTYSPSGNTTINQGVYCGGISFSSSVTLTLNSGIYYLDGGGLSVGGSASLVGNGPVTIILTSSTGNNYGTVNIGGSSTVNLSAMASGPTQGIALWVDKNAPSAFDSLGGGSSQVTINGAIYMPTQNVSYSGSADASGCNQIVAKSITLGGNSELDHNCGGYGVQEPGGLTGLVE